MHACSYHSISVILVQAVTHRSTTGLNAMACSDDAADSTARTTPIARGWWVHKTCALHEAGISFCNDKNFNEWKCWGETEDDANRQLMRHSTLSGYHRDYAKEDTSKIIELVESGA